MNQLHRSVNKLLLLNARPTPVFCFCFVLSAWQESNALTAGERRSHGASESQDVLAKSKGKTLGTVCRLL